MKTLLAPATLLLAAAIGGLAPAPAEAQRGGRILTIYGNDPCPTSNGEEIVVCARKPEGDRYRIPEELRGMASTDPGASSWANNVSSIEYAGRSGTMSCTPTGPGGSHGCWSQMMRAAREERRQIARDEANLPID